MEQLPTSKLNPETDRVLGVVEGNREAMWTLCMSLRIYDSFGSVCFHPNYRTLMHQAFQTDDNREMAEAVGGHDGIFGWRELSSQAELAFDEERFPRSVGALYLRSLETMSKAGKIIGATLATESIFSRLSYPDLHTHDEALTKLQETCQLDTDEMSSIIRLMAQPFGSEPTRGTSDKVFRVAVRHPDGLTRQAVSDDNHQIDTSYFGGNQIIERNLTGSFLEIVRGRDSSDFKAIRSEYPEDSAETLESADFLQTALDSIRHQVVYFNYKEINPLVMSVVSLDKVRSVIEKAQADMEEYLRDKQDTPGVIGDTALLKELGFDAGTKPHYYPHDALQNINQTLASLES